MITHTAVLTNQRMIIEVRIGRSFDNIFDRFM
jgi:hypothetical protein